MARTFGMLLALGALVAQAQSFDLYGVGPRSISMAGGGYTLDDPLQMANGLTLEGAVQVAITSGCNLEKAGPNQNPNYRFGGQVLTCCLGARYEF